MKTVRAVHAGVTGLVAIVGLLTGTTEARAIDQQSDSHHRAVAHRGLQPDILEEGNSEVEHAIKSGRSLPASVSAAAEAFVETFLPNIRFQPDTFSVFVATFIGGSLTFWIYFRCFYQNDRVDVEDVDEWKELLREAREQFVQKKMETRPDIIVVFHHPNHEREDGDTEVGIDSLNRLLVAHRENPFFDLLALKDKVASSPSLLNRARSLTRQMTKSLTGSSDRDAPKVSLKDVRKALACSLNQVLPHSSGVNVSTFKSVDEDELFVCLYMRRRQAINFFLAKYGVCLPLNRDMCTLLPGQKGDTMKINWEEPSSFPPLMAFDPVQVKTLHDEVFGAGGDDPDGKDTARDSVIEQRVFANYSVGDKETKLKSVEFGRILYEELCNHIDLGAAVDENFVQTWFPVHSPWVILELQAIWANWRCLSDLTFRQPISHLKEYYGARMAFVFAWNGLYCKALVPLVLLAIVWLLVLGVAEWAGYTQVHERQVIGFTTILCMWAKIALNYWSAETQFYEELWGMTSSTDNLRLTRPQFRGTVKPSPIDGNLEEIQEPKGRQKARLVIAAVTTYMFCIFVCFLVLTVLFMFKDRPAMIMPVALTMVIKALQLVFGIVVRFLTDFENHKYQTDYFDSYLWKLFVFEFVNNYSAFFFLTIKNTQDPDVEDGLKQPQFQVSMTLLLLAICSVIQVCVEVMRFRFKLWHEDYAYRREFHRDPPKRSFCEEQAKMITIDEPYEITQMMTLVIALGYVLLFGGVAPRVLIFTFVVFAVQLRAFAVLLTTSAQRTFPHRSRGIGNWSVVVTFLMNCGVLYSSFLFVAFGRTFKHADMMAKMTGFIVFLVSMYAMWGAIDLIVPGVSMEAHHLAERRHYVLKMIRSLTGKSKRRASQIVPGMGQADNHLVEAMEAGDWDLVPLNTETS